LNGSLHSTEIGVTGNTQHHRCWQLCAHRRCVTVGLSDVHPVGSDGDRERGIVIHKKG